MSANERSESGGIYTAEVECPGCEGDEVTAVRADERGSMVRCDLCGFVGELSDFELRK